MNALGPSEDATHGAASQSEPAGAEAMAPWTITRAEWMGQRRALRKQFGGIVFGLIMYVGAGAIAVAGGSWTLRFLVGLASVTVVSSLVPAIWHNRRLARALDLIWDEQGCVCPGCLIAVREQPCKHGLSVQRQPELVRYWEAVATQQVFEVMTLGRQLLGHRRWRWLGPIWRMTGGLMDPAIPMSRRLLLALCWSLVVVLPILLLVRFLMGVYLPGVVMLLGFLVPLWIAMSPAWVGSRGRARCVACEQELADVPPAHCPECNADLAVAGAVSSVQQHPRRLRSMLGVTAIVILSAALPFAAIMMTLPPWLSLQMAWITGPSPMLFYELSQRQLTPSQTRQAAELLLDTIERSSQRRVFSNGLLADALASGVLDESWAKRMAMAGVSVRAEPRVDEGVLTIDLLPTIGENLFALSNGGGVEPRMVLLEATLDGAPMELGRTRALAHDDVDQAQRAATLAMLPQQPVEVQEILKRQLAVPDRFTVTAPMDSMNGGEHVLKLRFVIVVTGPAFGRYEPAFRIDGSLITPDDAVVNGQERVYPFDHEVTITLPLR